MKITVHNYEALCLDYFEGQLQAEEVAELLLFLEQHPELKEGFESFEWVALSPINVPLPNKEKLKKYWLNESSIQSGFHRELLFAQSIEGELTPFEEEQLQSILTDNPQYLPEYNLYKRTRLVADKSIVFENKNSLKHRDFKILPIYYIVSAIAAVLVGIILFHNYSPDNFPTKDVAILRNPVVKNKVATRQIAATTESIKPNQCENHKPAILANRIESISKDVFQGDSTERREPTEIVEEIQGPSPNPNDTVTNIVSETFTPKGDLKPSLSQQEKSNPVLKTSIHNGWALAQALAKRLSKATGRIFTIKPKFAEDGTLTAYALQAGNFEMSRNK